MGSATLTTAGLATLATSALSLGQHSLAAVYGGDANNPGSTSSALIEIIVSGTAPPVLDSLSPSSTYAGGPAFTLTVTGSNFLPGSTVLWNGSSRRTTYFNGGTQLQAAITAADIAAAGSAVVTVSNATSGTLTGSSNAASNSANFTVLESFSGSGGFLSMFLSGANLGNSVLYQNNGLVGLNTTTPAAALDVNVTTTTGAAALNTDTFLGNTSTISGVVTSMYMTFDDNSQAPTLSKQTARMIYNRDATATGAVTFFDTILTASAFIHANAPYQIRGVNIEGPNVDTGKTLGNFTGLLISAPSGGGTVTGTSAILTAPNSGNVGFGTLAPATALQVVGDIRVGNSGSNGCLQNFSGGGLIGTCTSDARLKTNVLPFAPVLDKLVRLQPVHFDWKMDQFPEYHFGMGRNAGLLAQDVERVFPGMVTTDEHGFKMVNYSELPYLTLAAIRELKSENDSLRAQLAQMQTRLGRLERRRGTSKRARKANR